MINWQIVGIVLTAFFFFGNAGLTIYVLLSNKAAKKDDEKQTKGDLLVMKTIESLETKILGKIELLAQGQSNIKEDLLENKQEIKERQREAKDKADKITEMAATLKDISARLSKLDGLPDRVSHLERKQEELSRAFIEMFNEQKEKAA
jgi:hypothetical protein